MNRRELKEFRIQYILKNPKLSNSQLAKPLKFENGESVRKFRQKNRDRLPSKAATISKDDIPIKIAKFIKHNTMSLTDLSNKFGCDESYILSSIVALRDDNYIINEYPDGYRLGRHLPPSTNIFKGEEEIVLGVISDLHLGSKYDRVGDYEKIYDRFKDAGVNTVYLVGNYTHGVNPKYSSEDLRIYDQQSQMDELCKVLPRRDGITTKIMSGQCHEGWLQTREGIDVGRMLNNTALSFGRDDIISIGHMEVNEVYERNGGSFTVRLLHLGGGSAQAISNYSQKYIDTIPVDGKPDIILQGHTHKQNYMYYKGVYAIQTGCVTNPDSFHRKNTLRGDIGFSILRIKQGDDGGLISVGYEWTPLENTEWKYRGNG